MVKARASNRIVSPYEHWEDLTDARFFAAMEDFERFCEESLVNDKQGTPVPFKLNEAQKLFAEIVLKAIDPIIHKVPTPSIRILVHKSRQMGITTACLKLEQFILSKAVNFNGLHIMPTEDEADEMIDRKLIPLLQGTHPELMAEMNASGNKVDFMYFEENLLDNRLTFMSSGARGSGHGRNHAKSEVIVTPSGYVTFGDLRVGDTVYDRFGKETRVEDIYERGQQDIYRIKLQTGQSLEAGLDHRWLVRKKRGSKPCSVVETSEIIDRLNSGRTTYIPIADAIEGREIDAPIDPYILGSLLGDGWVGSRVSLSSKDIESTKLGSSYTIDKRTGVFNINMSNRIKKPWEELGLKGVHSWDKFVPKEYLRASVQQRKDLLAGLLDTDGSYAVKAGQVEFSSVSEDLALGVQELVRSLGGKASISSRESPNFRKPGVTGRTQYRVMINVSFNPFRLARKRLAWRKPQNTRWSKVVSVEKVGRADSVCIRVSSDDHTYIAGRDWVVTHNTIHLLVEDEHAKYQNPFTLEAGLLPAMGVGTVRIVLFTAKGMNHSYDLSKVAQDPESAWIYLFLPWYILAEYEMEPSGKYVELTDLSDYDMFLCEEFEKAGIPVEKWARKMQWYDYTFINEAKRDTQYMFENYPTVAQESFQASGAPIFDSTLLYKWMDTPYNTLDVFYNEGQTEFRYVDGGAIKEKKPPVKGHQYMIGIDPADGEVNGDDSAMVVWDVTNPEIEAVAAYNGTISQNDLAEMAYDLAIRYNEALLVPERNMGQLMIKWLTEIKGYMNIWTDAAKVTDYNNLGVRTTVPSKNEMVARLKFLMNNGYYKDFDPTFCEQGLYFTFQKTQGGQFRAAGDAGHHDDAVLARMLVTMALDMGRYKEYSESIVKEGRKYGR